MYRHAVCFPSATIEKAEECATEWFDKGYKVIILLDQNLYAQTPLLPATLLSCAMFRGYYKEITSIVDEAFRQGIDLVTCIGDDMRPPEQGADVHSKLYFDHFIHGEWGVMQCTGDRQGEKIGGKVNSERICGSPTFGRTWRNRAFQGNGPFGNYGFKSFYGDEMLKEVAEKLGLLYQEPALKIDHVHWAFDRAPRQPYHERAQLNWEHDKLLFNTLKEKGFPRSELL